MFQTTNQYIMDIASKWLQDLQEIQTHDLLKSFLKSQPTKVAENIGLEGRCNRIAPSRYQQPRLKVLEGVGSTAARACTEWVLRDDKGRWLATCTTYG